MKTSDTIAWERMREILQEKKQKGTLSLAHDGLHCALVAKFAGVVAQALADHLGFHEDIGAALAQDVTIAGYYHDTTREATEQTAHSVDAGAFFAQDFAAGLFPGMKELDRDLIMEAIRLHEGTFDSIREVCGDPLQPMKGKELLSIVAHALKIADGALEASGSRVVERRSFFVGGERRRKGDLHPIFPSPTDADWCVIGESLIRLYGKLLIASLPAWFRVFGEQLHAQQYLFYAGLLIGRSLSEDHAAHTIEGYKFPKFDKLLSDLGVEPGNRDQKREVFKHLDGSRFSADTYPAIAQTIDRIRRLSIDDRHLLAQAAQFVCFTLAWSRTPEEGIWILQQEAPLAGNPFLTEMVNGIVSYRAATEEMKAKVRQAVLSGCKAAAG